MKKTFITFGGGSQKWIDAGERLVRQIDKTQLFDETILFTDEYLKKDEYFWSKHGNFIENNKRGYGYWLWKPYITKITMDKMKDGDILFYLDSGCEFEFKMKDVLEKFFEYVKTELLIGTETDLPELAWTKMDLLVHLNAQEPRFSHSFQRQGGTNLFLVCNKTRCFVDEWYNTCCNYHLIDDSPSIHPNNSWFVEHRHDQSVYSILFKRYFYGTKNYSLFDCIMCHRNSSGISQIKDEE